jgi:fibro-slime domain-containing protein
VSFGGLVSVGGAAGGSAGTCSDPNGCRVGCGNGKVEPRLGEACDDGNSQSADGCSSDCKVVETSFACPEPGKPCVSLVHCGDGKLAGAETCDDGNTVASDGCGADCKLEPGWDCPTPSVACVPHCGDGVLSGAEQCDAPNVGHGCSADCLLEPGYVCTTPSAGAQPAPAVCHLTHCGDSTLEGGEACDDGNAIDGDRCSAACTLEPDCSSGTCASKCGDHVKLAPEECDDGNTRDGDGCSHDCKQEAGFVCKDTTQNPPAQLNLKVTYRDFISFPLGTAVRHPDFEPDLEAPTRTVGLVKAALAADGKPVIDGRCSELQPASFTDATLCPNGQMLTSQANFDQWYHDTPAVNIAIPSSLLLPRLASGAYVYDSAPGGFYPIDGKGFTAPPAKEDNALADATVNDGNEHDFGFTTELRYFFQYRGGESLAFSGDDDLWIFIGRKLALDVGGLHPRSELALNLDTSATALGLTRGSLYEIALFHAERHSAGSNFKLTLTGFAPTYSLCAPACGDGVVVPPEQCDLGTAMNTGAYAGCTADCRRGPFCGDARVQAGNEQCDDGVNLTTYGTQGSAGCAPGCVLSGYCGDGKLDGLFGEQCDLGTAMNSGDYNACASDCQLGPRCGDGVLQKQFGELCDDGNTVSGDGCGFDCKPDLR